VALELEKGDGAPDASVVKENLAAYASLLRGHIAKEDTILYPMADTTFSPEDQQALLEAFERVESEMGEGTHEKYHALADRLAADCPARPGHDPIAAGGIHACPSFCH
jgi:hemerythrin-like domain-containing protein